MFNQAHGSDGGAAERFQILLQFQTNFSLYTCAGQVQFSLAKPQLGSVNGAGVELDPEHHLSLCCSAPSVVALYLRYINIQGLP